MTKNTHLAAGVALTLGIIHPENPTELAICLASASIGSVISDIDVSTSKSRKELNKILVISVTAICVCVLIESILHIGILEMIQNQSNITRILLGFMMMLLICCFGVNTSHRTFTHSLIGVVSLTGSVFVMLPEATFAFAISMFSHIFLDFFNTKKVQIFYPLKKPKICFKLCKASSPANKMIFMISTIIVVIEIILFIWFRFIS